MSQNSVVLPTTGTVSGLQMTQATNNALDTLNTLASGASAPSSPVAGQLWHDTSANIIKLRSADNTTWIAWLNVNEAAYLASPVVQAGSLGFVNRIINGTMAVDQVNEGASYTIPTNNTYVYTADQWVVACLSSTAAAVSAQRVADAPAGFTYSLKCTVGTGASSVATTDYYALWQPVEAQNLSDLNFGTASAGTLSLSFWVKASVSGTYAVTLQNAAGSRACVNKFTVSTAGSWQFVTIAGIPCDQSGTWASGNVASLYVYFVLAAGTAYQSSTLTAWQGGAFYASTTHTNSLLTTSGASFQVTGVMLNAGVFTQPYEKRSIQQELQLCQRYYFKTFPQGIAVAQNAGLAGALATIQGFGATANNQVSSDIRFPVPMRVTPTVVTYNPLASNAQFRNQVRANDASNIAANIQSAANWSFTYTTSSGSVTGDGNAIHMTASARM